MSVHSVVAGAAVAAVAAMSSMTQPAARVQAMVEVLRPLLPYPQSTPAGDLPFDNSASSRWFVVWPADAGDARVIVRANPLHPDVQQASAAAMEDINKAVAAAERRARESYERALERLRKTGKGGELDAISLDDEGVAGQRIDAELEVTIDLGAAEAVQLVSGERPIISTGTRGPAWVIRVPANTYHVESGGERREQFRAEEARLYFGVSAAPSLREVAPTRYDVALTAGSDAFAVVIRGNAALVSALATADWSSLVPR
jgi:hypothetical protein